MARRTSKSSFPILPALLLGGAGVVIYMAIMEAKQKTAVAVPPKGPLPVYTVEEPPSALAQQRAGERSPTAVPVVATPQPPNWWVNLSPNAATTPATAPGWVPGGV